MDVVECRSPISSDMPKKIKRKHFKPDIVLKSFKCDFISPNISTQAKMYIMNSVIHVAHKPKLQRLTTIPFDSVLNIEARHDVLRLNFRIINDVVYTFANFERPEYAFNFILTYWDIVLKEKLLKSIGSHERLNISPTDVDLLKASTTISLNSSTSISDRDSSDFQKCLDAAKSTTDLDDPQTSDRLPSSYSTTSISDLQVQTNQPSLSRVKLTSVGTLSPQSDPSMTTRSCQSFTSAPGSPTHSSSTTKQNAIVCLTELSGWTFWLLGMLPYPLRPPQRFTMALAYVILAFLLFSTIHLYHRLAVFDLLSGRVLNLDMPTSVPVHRPSSVTWQESVRSLESDLSVLIQLVEQLSQSLLRLTVELHDLSAMQVPSTDSETSVSST